MQTTLVTAQSPPPDTRQRSSQFFRVVVRLGADTWTSGITHLLPEVNTIHPGGGQNELVFTLREYCSTAQFAVNILKVWQGQLFPSGTCSVLTS